MRSLAAACAVLSLAIVMRPAAQPPATRTIHRHFTAADRETGRYQYLPFEVAAGTASLTISYRYSGDKEGASVIDLGLFEPGPLTLATPAFRGYSGGAQRTITVGRDRASPAYRAGPLPAGTWHVLLGLYKVAPGGVDVDLDVTASRTEPTTASSAGSGPPASNRGPGPPTAAPSGAAPRWYTGGLHLHTTHSDGSISPGALAAAARAAGLDFIAVTDHNNTTHAREAMPASPLHIVGEEVTTPGGHANVWGLPPDAWVDFRVRPGDPGAAAALDRFVAEAHRHGALFSINHPIGACAGCSWEHAIPGAIDAVEIWNGPNGPQEASVAIWDRLLRAGRRVTGVGASDWHRAPAPIDAPVVRVLAADLTRAAILDGIRRGHLIVMRDARSATPSVLAACGNDAAGIGGTLACAPGDAVRVRVTAAGAPGGRADLILNGDRVASKPIGEGALFETPATPGYLRVHVHAADGATFAITNPIHVTVR